MTHDSSHDVSFNVTPMLIAEQPTFIVLDTSAILSGKPLHFPQGQMMTTSEVIHELQPGGKDHRTLSYLLEKGLTIHDPTPVSCELVRQIATKTGDIQRLSPTDISVLALALDFHHQKKLGVWLLTDDYTMQNVALALELHVESISQKGITKRFIWTCRCQGCGKKFKEHINICPICGATTKTRVSAKKDR
jgi:UPF0271 protein